MLKYIFAGYFIAKRFGPRSVNLTSRYVIHIGKQHHYYYHHYRHHQPRERITNKLRWFVSLALKNAVYRNLMFNAVSFRWRGWLVDGCFLLEKKKNNDLHQPGRCRTTQ